jgi:cysteine desulfurase / selenocysteine lyase
MNDCRFDFPMLQKKMHGKPLIYLDSAATAQKPQVVIDAISSFYQDNYGTVHRAVYELAVFATDRYQKVRKQVQSFLNASKTDEIIFTRGTTESINLIAYSFGKAFIKPKDEILISEMEHHSNIVPWQLMAEDRGAILKVIPFDDQGILDLNAYQALLSSRTKIVSIAHISNTLGTINPIKQMVQMAHEAGASVLVDGAQAAPHHPLDVQDLDADFYVFSGHKTYGPTGIGVLYGKESLLNEMPPYQGGGDMIEKVTFEKTTYNVLPTKFEAGTPLIAEVIGLGSALEYLEKVGRDAVFAWEQELIKEMMEGLKSIPGLKVIGESAHKGGLASFTVEGLHPLDIGTMLDLKGIAIRTGHLCAQPVMRHFGLESVARASVGLYTSKEDIEQFIQALSEVVKILR